MVKKSSASSRPGRLRGTKQLSTSDLTPEMKADLEYLSAQSDEAIDTSDPNAPDRSAESGWVRGKFYRPIKKPISIRVDMDVLDWFKSQRGPYQSLMNQALRRYMESELGHGHKPG